MQDIYICPNCKKIRSLDSCDCNYNIEVINNIYNFLDKDYVSDFDKIGKYYYDTNNYEITKEIARVISLLLKEGTILDLGCGNGNLSIPLLNYNYNLISLDSSFVMLNELVKKNEFENKLTIIRADVNDIPIKDESISLILANNLFHLIDNPTLLLNNIYSLLIKDGLFIQISDSPINTYIEDGESIELYNQITMEYFNRYWDQMRKKSFYPNKYKSDFNLHIEASKLFNSRYSINTNPVEYEGYKTIADFVNKELYKSDYSKLHIPFYLHKEIHIKIIDEFVKIYGKDYDKIKIKYYGKLVNIIDVYKK